MIHFHRSVLFLSTSPAVIHSFLGYLIFMAVLVLSSKIVKRFFFFLFLFFFLFSFLFFLNKPLSPNATDDVVSLALCPQVVCQVLQRFRSSETQATCDGCFTLQSVCSVISLHSGRSRALHPQEFPKVDVEHATLGLPFHVSFSFSFFYIRLIESVTRQCPQTTTFSKRKVTRSGIEPRLFCLTARPNAA